MPRKGRALTVITVAGLHGIALYALMTGLGVDYVKNVVTVIKGESIPLEPMPTPSPPPEAVRVEKVIDSSATPPRVAPPVDATRTEFADDAFRIDFPLRPFDTDFEAGPGSTPSATPDRPQFVARGVRPRGAPGGWVSTSDYPSASLRRGEQGTVRFELAVGANGRVADCRITTSSGSADLDAATCRLVARRAQFDPAMDESGGQVTGAYSGTIRWVIPRD
jgi:protein TonB